MKTILCLALLIVATIAAEAQTPVRPSTFPPGLRLDESSWIAIHPTFVMGNLFGSSSGGSRNRGSVAHPIPLSGNRLRYGSNGPAAGSSGVSYGHKALWFRASAKLTNENATAIKSIRMEFVFTDAATSAEVLRIKHRSKKHLKLGKSYVYEKTVKNSQRIRRGKDGQMRVEITEVIYADGSVWRPTD